MMIKFDTLEPMKIYRVRDRYTLPYNNENQTKGNLVTVFSENLKDTADFFDRRYIQFRRYLRYYLELRIRTSLLNRQIRILNDQGEMFNESGMNRYNIRLCKHPSLVSDFNFVYELSQYINLAINDDRVNKKSPIIRAQVIYDFISSKLMQIDKQFPNHKKYIYIPIDKFMSDPRDATAWIATKHYKNTLIGFIRSMFKNPDRAKSSLYNWTFVFNNVNEMFYFNCKDITSTTYDDLKILFRKCRSKVWNVIETDIDDMAIGDDEDQNTLILPETNKISSDIVLEKTKNEVRLSSLPQTVKDNVIQRSETIITTLSSTKAPDSISVSKESSSENKQKNKTTDDLSSKKLLKTNNNIKPNTLTSANNKIVSTDELNDTAKRIVKEELNKITMPSKSIKRLARTEKIQKEMSQIKINDEEKISDLSKKAESKVIENHEIKANVINPKIKNIKIDNFEKGYNTKLMDYDLTNILMSFANKDRPLYLISLNKEDTSTATDKMYTYTAVFEDENGKRHNVVFDVPKFVNYKFIHLNGSDKIFINQILPLPVTKTSSDEVQVSSSYNKIFIRRFGKNVSSKISKFYKAVPNIDRTILTCTNANNIIPNSPYMTTIEYDELSSKYDKITLSNGDIIIYLNQPEIRSFCITNDLKWDDDKEIPFAISKTKTGDLQLITLNTEKDTVMDGFNDKSPIDYIIDIISKEKPSFKSDFSKLSGAKKMIYTRATIMAKKVPIVLLLGFLDGLIPLMDRMKVNYTFTEKRPVLKEDSTEKTIVTFKDGYLVYDAYPFANSLILNGLADIPTEEYNFMDLSSKNAYYDIFTLMYGRRNIGNAFENFNQLFIDPITKEILEDYNLPTNFIDLILYANSLLENNAFDLDGDLKNYRIRSNELINAHLYKLLSSAYESYRATADNKNPNKFSIKRKDLINDIFNSQIMEEYSTLNPIFEIDRMRATSYKGPGGCNVDRAYNIEKRAYNDSMMGVLAQSTPISANVGVSRIMSLNPNITSLRGYIDPGDREDMDKLDETNMLSGAELLAPLAATHDDPQRVSMTSTQSRHTIATKDSDTPLFGYGMDKVLPNVISDRFAFKAKQDGQVEEINEKLGYMLLRYNDGSTDVVDISNRQALNTGSGFYITNKLTPNIITGTRFKSGEVVARNAEFFEYDKFTKSTVYKSGPLTRVAVIHSSAVFEDSTIFTERLADRMSSYVTDMKDIRLGKNTNIYHMAKIGDKIEAGDPLLIFDESYSDEYLSRMLEKMNDSDRQDLIEAARTPIKSKHNGEIIDIKIYYTIPKEELSESLQNIINSYETNIKRRLSKFKRAGVNMKDLVSLNETDEVTVPVNGKITGIKMDDNVVLIKFYIRTLDKFSVGDKATFAVALKATNHKLIPEGKEPFIVSDPNEKVDAFIGVSGYYSRMTNSFAISLALNTVLLGAEKKIADILKK